MAFPRRTALPAAVNQFPAAGMLGCPPRLNVSKKKQKKPRNPPASPFSSPPTSPFTTQYWICRRGGHPRRICAIARDLARCCAAETPVEPAAAESTRVGAKSAVPELVATDPLRTEPPITSRFCQIWKPKQNNASDQQQHRRSAHVMLDHQHNNKNLAVKD